MIVAMLPDSLRLTAAEQAELSEIQRTAQIEFDKRRKAAAKRGRKDYPAFPFECSWAYETQFLRQKRHG
jgi:hypothetical protein